MAHGAVQTAGTHVIDEEHVLYGLSAEFETPEQLVAAARAAAAKGYRRMDGYSPFTIEGLSEALEFRDLWVPRIMLVGGILGALSGISLLYYCMELALPLNIAGRPVFSWPVCVPITFECTVLFSALIGIVGMCVLNGLPQPFHPVFDTPGFDRATVDRFFLCIEAADSQFDMESTRSFLESTGAAAVNEIHSRIK